MLLEPDRRLRATLRDVLHGEGWSVLDTECGAEALELATIAQPGLAVVDMAPARDAESFSVALRIRYGLVVPILAISRQYIAPQDRDQVAAGIGAYDVLGIPFDVARFQALLWRAEQLASYNRSLRRRSEDALANLRALRLKPHGLTRFEYPLP